MISYLFHWYPLAYFLSEDINLFVEPLKNQFLSLFFRFCCFLLFIPNFLFLCFFISIILFFFPIIFFLLFLLFSLSSSSSSLFSSSFWFCYPGFFCFGLYCFPQFSGHLVIFTSPILQSISELWQAGHSIFKIILYFYLSITSISVFFLCFW